MAGRKQLVTTARELEALARLFRALRSAPRLRMLEALRDQPKCVTHLAQELEMPQNNVSTHLKRLSDVGLVLHTQSGRWRFHRVPDTRTFQILNLAYGMLADRDMERDVVERP